MREVIVRVRCDRCAESFDVENNPNALHQDVPLVLGKDTVMLDLCYGCMAILEADLAALIAHGRPVKPVKVARKKRTVESKVGLRCPECEQVRETSQALGIHRYRAHGVRGASRKVNA